jgi:hypothetical protein
MRRRSMHRLLSLSAALLLAPSAPGEIARTRHNGLATGGEFLRGVTGGSGAHGATGVALVEAYDLP